MAFFNESYTNQQLAILNEKKSTEEYHRRSFKKKYNFEPDKPGSNTGKITVDGKKYDVDMKKNKTMEISGQEVKRQTMADLSSKDGRVMLDKNFFKAKGSNKSERRDALLQHEIGHQKLHNLNPDSTVTEKKNRTPETFKKTFTGMVKDQVGVDISNDKKVKDAGENDPHKYRKTAYDSLNIKDYTTASTADKKEKKERNDALKAASKYEKDSAHANATEYEADRHAANKTSEGAIKRGVRQLYKEVRKDDKKEAKSLSSNPFVSKKDINDSIKKKNSIYETDKEQRSKALKDEDMRKSKVYK